MRSIRKIVLCSIAMMGMLNTAAWARTSPFASTITYQGRLLQSGQLVNSSQPVVFRLFDALTGGSQIGATVNQNVNVANGLFTSDLDFTNGDTIPGVYDGSERWLEITVNGTTLTPRQRLAPAPNAMVARTFAAPLVMSTDSPIIMNLTSTANVGQARPFRVVSTSDQIGAISVFGECADETANTFNVGVYGLTHSGNGFGIIGANIAPGGNDAGIYGTAASPAGAGVYAEGSASTGVNYGIYGRTFSPDGYGGYFDGKGHFTKFLGVGRLDPVTGSDMFAVQSPSVAGYGGMYVETVGANAWPFYGYATNGVAQMWTYYDGSTDKWHVHHGANRITVQANGNVGIGTETPAFLFHVNGTAGKPGGGSWSNASDVRLKTNIHDLDNVLDRYLALHGVSYEYIDPQAIHELPGQQIGMIAQEVETVFPQWVDAGPDGYKRLTYRGFEALSVEAVRQLRAEKDAQIEQLRAEKDAQIDDLRARLETLENAMQGLLAKHAGANQ